LDDKQPLLAPGIAGVNSVTLAKAAWASAFNHQWLDFPINADEIEEIYEKIAESL
jgi:hypothetical protein